MQRDTHTSRNRPACGPAAGRRSDRRGAMLVLIVISMFILLAFVAFSVDVAYMQLARTELRAATDACARAGTEALSREQDSTAAVRAAKRIARRNSIGGQPLILARSDIEIGQTRKNQSGAWVFVPDASPPNAVRVTGRRTANSPGGAVPLFFSKVFGLASFQPTQTAVASQLDRDIAVVVDHSGSMAWNNRWPGLLNAIRVFLAELKNTPQYEIVGLAGYSSAASQLQALTSNIDLINLGMTRLSPLGMTNIGGGLQVGSDMLLNDPAARPLAAKTIILMTDGNHNTGTNPINTANAAARRNHTVHTITFGSGANQYLMRRVAILTGGNHYHADNNVDLAAVFREIALTLPIVLTE